MLRFIVLFGFVISAQAVDYGWTGRDLKLPAQTANKILQLDSNNIVTSTTIDASSLQVLDESAVYTVQTTDDTVTTIATIALDDLTAILINSECVGIENNADSILFNQQSAGIYRDGAGAVREGSVVNVFNRQRGSGMAVDTTVSGDDAIVTVEGDPGITVNWECRIRVLRR